MQGNNHSFKVDLSKICLKLIELQEANKLSSEALFEAGKNISLAFFIIRKLLENKTALSEDIHQLIIGLRAYKATSRLIVRGSLKKVDGLYDLAKFNEEDRSLEYACNQIIHSFIYELKISADQKTLMGLFYASDKTKNKEVYYSTIEEIIDVISRVALDKPDQIVYSYDHNKREDDIIKFKPGTVPEFGSPEFFEWFKLNFMNDFEANDKKAIKFSSVEDLENQLKGDIGQE